MPSHPGPGSPGRRRPCTRWSAPRNRVLAWVAMIFDGFSRQIPDIDPEETTEWVDSFDAVVDARGKGRAQVLIVKLLERAQPKQVALPAAVSTPSINTIPPEHAPRLPCDEAIE